MLKGVSRKIMKRFWILTLAFALFVLSGCASGQPQKEEALTVDIYYLNKGESKTTPVEYKLKSTDKLEQVTELLEKIKESPSDATLKSPICNDVEIIDYKVEDTLCLINLNSAYLKLPATTEILVRAALVRTMSEIEGIDQVLLTVEGETLNDSLGNPVGSMSADMFIENAGNEINSYEKVSLKLYFANEAGDSLVAITETGVYSSNISMEKLVVERLIAGPAEDAQGAYPVINPDTKILGVTVKDGTCYVNLDNSFLTKVYNVTGDVVIYAITNSLIELPGINKVQFSVNGDSSVTFRENHVLTTVYERNLDLLQKEE